MSVKEYITDTINKHQKEFGIDFDIHTRDVIEKNINGGVYAFQIIYNGQNQVQEIKNLNYSLLKSTSKSLEGKEFRPFKNKYGHVENSLWSYDGGVRYQWSNMETLVFVPSVIRNIKIEEIIK